MGEWGTTRIVYHAGIYLVNENEEEREKGSRKERGNSMEC